jgi:hypothetical protein
MKFSTSLESSKYINSINHNNNVTAPTDELQRQEGIKEMKKEKKT